MQLIKKTYFLKFYSIFRNGFLPTQNGRHGGSPLGRMPRLESPRRGPINASPRRMESPPPPPPPVEKVKPEKK